MILDNSYYEDEVRENFYIPGMIKRSWASQMEILEKVTEICDKYNIRWFADYGTLIGAIRHHGFIPWDDDLDICMLKEDYDRFLDVAKDELPDGYRILNIYKEAEYTNFLTRVVNHSVIDTGRDFLENNHGFPYVSGIDIFPLHYLYADEEKEDERQKRANKIYSLLVKHLTNKSRSIADEKTLVGEVEKISGIRVGKYVSIENAIYRVLDTMYSSVSPEDAEHVALIRFWIERRSHRFPLSIYKDTVDMPFEDRTIRVPVGYEQLLRLEYGNWEKTDQHGGMHNYPFYTEQEEELEKHREGKVPYRYYFDKNDLVRPEVEDKDGNLSIFNMIEKAHDLVEHVVENGVAYQCIDILQSCQELAIKIGEDVENIFGDDGKYVVCKLEFYCEMLYEISTLIVDNAAKLAEPSDEISQRFEFSLAAYDVLIKKIDELKKCLRDIKQGYETLKRNECIFIISGMDEWLGIEKYYKYIKKNTGKHVYLMPVVRYKKDWNGSLTEDNGECCSNQNEWCGTYGFSALYIEKLLNSKRENNSLIETCGFDLPSEDILDYQAYDFSKHRPDIFIADPLDAYREAVSVHPFFYASNLRKYTDNLIYIHKMPESAPKLEDVKGIANSKRYILSPGVVMCDTVYVPNEAFRELYVSTLLQVDDSISVGYWENKIRILQLEEQTSDEREIIADGRKTILFYTSFSGFYTYREKAIDKLKSVIEIFLQNRDYICVSWIVDNDFEQNMREKCYDIWHEFSEVVDLFSSKENGRYLSAENHGDLIKNCDAYYGSGGYYLNSCVIKGIPTMLWNIEV